MTKGHNFVETIDNPLSYTRCTSSDHDKTFAKFRVNWIKDVTGIAATRAESAMAATP